MPFLRIFSLHFGHVPIASAPLCRQQIRLSERRIIAGTSGRVHEALRFYNRTKDLYPKAPVHLLIIPKRHIDSIAHLEGADAEVIGRCFTAARALGETKGFAEKGYRISINTGPEGGQVVYHVHFHFTAGRARGHGA